MNIVVLVKQVPDMEQVKFNREKGTVDRSSAGVEVNPFDLNALETAVAIRELTGNTHVCAVSMGPPQAANALRECIARGADDALLVSDAKFGGSDTRATSLILAAAVRAAGPFDLVITGEKTVDGDTGQVGPELAEYLRLPHAGYVSAVQSVGEDSLDVVSDIWEGTFLKRLKFPALISVTKDINQPRLPSFKSKMAARKAEIRSIGFDALTEYLKPENVGFKGSPTKVKKIEVPPALTRDGHVYREDEAGDGLDALLAAIGERRIL
ncbi:MAG TPA: electron transfer flavoprotein, beta subunit [Ruminococcaceae bacterium]|jgi:electron transfer flavoprotein beta subunit|nr:electron transfer flavoprotein, beta subunit [Oscillospiraceae bacterium]